MREFMVFCVDVLKQLVNMLFDIDIGGYSYGAFLVVVLLVSVLVDALVIRFGSGDYGAAVKPRKPPKSNSKGGRGGSPGRSRARGN